MFLGVFGCFCVFFECFLGVGVLGCFWVFLRRFSHNMGAYAHLWVIFNRPWVFFGCFRRVF